MAPMVAPTPVMMSTTMMVRTMAFRFVFQLETVCLGSRRLHFVVDFKWHGLEILFACHG